MKRQKIQRELLKLEQENLEKREEIIVKKDETPTKLRATAMVKVRDQFQYLCAKEAVACCFKFYNWSCIIPKLNILRSNLDFLFFSQASPEQLCIKDSPSPRKSGGSPKHKSGNKGQGSGKKEKKAPVSSPVSESAR